MGFPITAPHNALDDALSRPLQGYIVCCTSIPPEQRADLASSAEQMGAVHKFDLTSDVTHLVVGDTDTPKYKFVAKERLDVVCVLPSWIEAVKESWMSAGEVDVLGLEKEHRLPILHRLNICVTGFADPDCRKDLENRIIAGGGSYKPNLTKEETHLVAKEPTGAKYEFAEKWRIKTVGVEWLDQSLERGMILEENLFHPLLPVEKRGAGAWVRKSTSTTSLGKRTRGAEPAGARSRKLRRTASAKLERETSGIWDNIIISESKAEVKKSEWDDEAEQKPGKSRGCDEIQSDSGPLMKGTKSVSPSEYNLSGKSVHRDTPRKDIFSGRHFVLHGFNDKKTAVLEDHIRSRDGNICDFEATMNAGSHVTDSAMYMVVPHNMPPEQYPDAGREIKLRDILATELWVQRCLHRKLFEEPSSHVANLPLKCFPTPGFQELKVCSTAFQGVDLLVMATLVRTLGANYDQLFDPTTSVLVCNDAKASVEKLGHAAIWGVPAVRAEWFWDSARNGKRMPYGPYLLQPVKHPRVAVTGGESSNLSEQLNQPRRATTRSSKLDSKESTSSERVPLIEGNFKRRRKETVTSIRPDTPQEGAFPDDAGPHMEMLDHGGFTESKASNTDSSYHNPSLKPSVSAPLQEITPNSSPPKPPPKEEQKPTPAPTSPRKPSSPITFNKPSSNEPPDQEDEDTLGPAISSLLAHHHQRKASLTKNNPTTAFNDPQPRRRRQLLGRAPSTLSNQSHGLSRASSVDTAHTDGLGTPLDAASSLSLSNQDPSFSNKVSNVVYDHHADHEAEMKRQEEQLQMTQLGYEDPDAEMWRERVGRKLRGEKVGYGKGATPRKGGGGGRAIEGTKKGEGLGISRRTRMAGGGR